MGASTRGNGVELGEVEVKREIGIDWGDECACVGRLRGVGVGRTWADWGRTDWGWVGGGGTDWGCVGASGTESARVGGECFVGGWAAGGDAEGGL
jgi:hypothetical protein